MGSVAKSFDIITVEQERHTLALLFIVRSSGIARVRIDHQTSLIGAAKIKLIRLSLSKDIKASHAPEKKLMFGIDNWTKGSLGPEDRRCRWNGCRWLN